MVRFPNAAQRRQRAQIRHIAKVSLRTLQTIAIAAFVAVESPMLIMMALLVAHWTIGVSKEQGESAVHFACVIAKATYVYGPLCGSF